MNKVQGSADVRLIECVNPVQKKWRVRWGVETTPDGETSYMEEEFSGKPSVETVKSLILGWMNERIDERIASGFTYEGNPVWLSQTNQFNYKSSLDLAVQTNGENLPVKFKFGTDDEPVYVVFDTTDKLRDFYKKVDAYIKQTLVEGWQQKDAIDFNAYK